MNTPLIGLVCRHDSSAVYGNEPVQVQSDAYLDALVAVGATPFLVPLNLPEARLKQLYHLADGILLTGGGDLDPGLYPAAAEVALSDVQPDRDQIEIQIAAWAAADQKPLLGICRGLQVLAVWSGGSLCPDIPSLMPEATLHQYRYLGEDLTALNRLIHDVHLEPESRLAQVFETTCLPVNSLHHQAATAVDAPLKIVGCSDDGLIEAVEIPEHPFFCAVQWHPELLFDQQETARNLFRAFVNSCTTPQAN